MVISSTVNGTVTGVIFHGRFGSDVPDRQVVSEQDELDAILKKGKIFKMYCSCGIQVTYDEPIKLCSNCYIKRSEYMESINGNYGNLNRVHML